MPEAVVIRDLGAITMWPIRYYGNAAIAYREGVVHGLVSQILPPMFQVGVAESLHLWLILVRLFLTCLIITA